jgi:hypothetical protein
MMTMDAVERIAPTGKVWQTGLLAVVVAAVLNLIVYVIASALGVTFNITPPEMPAPPFALAVIFATAVGVLLGTLLFWQMPRFSKKPVTTWRMVAIIALVLSLIQPLILLTGAMGPAASISTVIVLEIMHLIAGGVAIYLLTTRARA